MAEKPVHERSASFISLQMNCAASTFKERQKKNEDMYQQILQSEAFADQHSTGTVPCCIEVQLKAYSNYQFIDVGEQLNFGIDEYGIELNLRNQYEGTAFLEALKQNATTEVIIAIAKLTKDVNESDDRGKTALHYVVTYPCQYITSRNICCDENS
jgi:hypothetical protein